MTRYFQWAGGRKTGLGLIAVLLFVAMAVPLDATFVQFMGGVLGALGLTQATVAYEDSRRGQGES